MTARRDLYAVLMAGGPHSPDRSEKASQLIDEFRAEVLAEAKAETVAWLVKKAGERRAMGRQYAKQADVISQLASKVDRGAVRIFLIAEGGDPS
ncbi:hypothetical protein AB0M57_04285 [Streptomyces sp. NPDC051597]|uniref:hypothetical protein n=1 Tax=Streptomyces sp. NPDC051597 TaxID=3155049 RepID=UPI003434A6C7